MDEYKKARDEQVREALNKKKRAKRGKVAAGTDPAKNRAVPETPKAKK